MTMDYAQIIEGCRRHDRRAQKALYDAFAPMAMGVCMRYTQNRDEAQDLMQEGFVRVYEHLWQVRDAEHVGAWVYKVILNECLKHYRRHERPRFLDDEEIDVVQWPDDPFGTEEVVVALQQIPPAQRTAFNLMEVEGCSFEEAAEKMKCTEVNVRSLLSRAKMRLRDILTTNREK